MTDKNPTVFQPIDTAPYGERILLGFGKDGQDLIISATLYRNDWGSGTTLEIDDKISEHLGWVNCWPTCWCRLPEGRDDEV